MDIKNMNLKLNADYIGNDEIVKNQVMKAIEMNDVILLVAPQGTGKTHFFETSLGDRYRLISPTRALANQVNANNSIDEMVANTFIQGLEFIKNDITEIKYVVIDEFHYLCNYQMFAYEQVKYFEAIYEICMKNNIKIIYVTATSDSLYCLEGLKFYDEIEIKITIRKDKQYVNNVYVYDSMQKEELFNSIINNYNFDNLQVVLYNDTKGIEAIKDKLVKQRINAMALSSENKLDGDNAIIFRSLTHNRYIDLDVLLVTSWADVGINLINDNITDIYYICDSEYIKGDLVSMQQFIARPRNCLPNLYIVQPKLSVSDKKIISEVSKINEIKNYEIISDLAENKTNSQYYQALLNTQVTSYSNICYEINERGADIRCTENTPYIISDTYMHFIPNLVAIKLNIHKLIDKCVLIKNMWFLSDYFEFEIIKKIRMENVLGYSCPIGTSNKVLNYLDKCAKTEREFITQEAFKKELSKILGVPFNRQLSYVISEYGDVLNITYDKRKSHGNTIYTIKYIDEYNPYSIYTGEIPDYIDFDVEVDEDGIMQVDYIINSNYSFDDIVYY